MQKNASGRAGAVRFLRAGAETPALWSAGRCLRMQTSAAGRCLRPALLRARASVRRGGGGERSGGRGFCNINTKNKKFFQDKY